MYNFRFAIQRQNKQGLTHKELAKKGGVSYQWLQNMTDKDNASDFGFKRLDRFCKENGFDVVELIHDAMEE